MSTTPLKEQIKALKLAINDPKNKKIKAQLQDKLDDLEAQLAAEGGSSTDPKPKKEKKSAAKEPEALVEDFEISDANIYKEKIEKAKAALVSRATDESMKPDLQTALNTLLGKAKSWEDRQKKAKAFKTTDELTAGKKKTAPAAKTTGKKTVTKVVEDEVEIIGTVEIGGKTYNIDACQGKYIKWYNETFLK